VRAALRLQSRERLLNGPFCGAIRPPHAAGTAAARIQSPVQFGAAGGVHSRDILVGYEGALNQTSAIC